MTRKEFGEAIEAIRQGRISRQPSRAAEVEEAQRAGRVLAAMCLVMRSLRIIPEEKMWEPTRAQILEFIDSLNEHLWRMLKRIAEEEEEMRRTRRHSTSPPVPHALNVRLMVGSHPRRSPTEAVYDRR